MCANASSRLARQKLRIEAVVSDKTASTSQLLKRTYFPSRLKGIRPARCSDLTQLSGTLSRLASSPAVRSASCSCVSLLRSTSSDFFSATRRALRSTMTAAIRASGSRSIHSSMALSPTSLNVPAVIDGQPVFVALTLRKEGRGPLREPRCVAPWSSIYLAAKRFL
jgi:hypothetical protein